MMRMRMIGRMRHEEEREGKGRPSQKNVHLSPTIEFQNPHKSASEDPREWSFKT